MRTATIVIRDEVNIKIEGLELDARRALVMHSSMMCRVLDTCPQSDWDVGMARSVISNWAVALM
jgi:hypothetical protein